MRDAGKVISVPVSSFQVDVQYPHIGGRQIQISPPPGRQDQSKGPPQGQQ